MKKVFGLFIVLVFLLPLQHAFALQMNEAIKSIKNYCESVDKNIRRLHKEEFVYPFSSCGGGKVIRFRDKNKVVKIEEDISMSNGRMIRDYYLNHNELIGCYERKMSYHWDSTTESFDHTHFSDQGSEKMIYFFQGKIIYRQQTDRELPNFNSDNLRKEGDELIEETTKLSHCTPA